MSLNPLTLINQAIEEHGSAGIMGKHLAFVKDQLAALKDQLAIDGRRTVELVADNARLTAENENLRHQIQNLRPVADGLDDDAAKILKFYYGTTEGAAIHYVAERLGLQPNEAAAHAHDLYELDYLGLMGVEDSPVYYIITKGTKYAMKHLR